MPVATATHCPEGLNLCPGKELPLIVEWSQLLLPVALATIAVFIASSVIHMVLKWHNPDYRALANEDAVGAALREGGVTPGQYVFPHCLDPKEMTSPETAARFAAGPVGLLYIRPSGATKIGPFLAKWVAYSLLVSAVVAYVARSQLEVGATSVSVFQLVGVVTWMAYSFGGPIDSIWAGKPWVVTAKYMVDGLIYAACTAGVFAWLWPQ